jgi:hypothetical protein
MYTERVIARTYNFRIVQGAIAPNSAFDTTPGQATANHTTTL